jgi:hypothetical protein
MALSDLDSVGGSASVTRQAALRPRSEGLAFLERHVALPRYNGIRIRLFADASEMRLGRRIRRCCFCLEQLG